MRLTKKYPFLQNKLGTGAALTLNLLILIALLTPLISPYTYYETHLTMKNMPPSMEFWFGTDELGRDIFTRIAFGTRISLFVGIGAASIDLLVGVLFGAFAGSSGGKMEEFMMRTADILYSIPYLLTVILLTVIGGGSLFTIIIALTLTGWIGMARIVRGKILQLKEMDFIKAAVALGASRRRILFYHLIPNCMNQIIITMMLTIPSAIFAEAFLSFLGLGVQAPIASLGTMANDGLSALRSYPWRLFFPAGFISVILLSFFVLGESLQSHFDPRQDP
jgi:oligopeptide transport system permease protein